MTLPPHENHSISISTCASVRTRRRQPRFACVFNPTEGLLTQAPCRPLSALQVGDGCHRPCGAPIRTGIPSIV